MKAKDIREKIRELLDEYGYPYEVERSFSNEKVSLIDVFSEDPTPEFKEVEEVKLLAEDYLNLASCVKNDINSKGIISHPINEGEIKGFEKPFSIHKESVIGALCGIYDKIKDKILIIRWLPLWCYANKIFTLYPNNDDDFNQIIEILKHLIESHKFQYDYLYLKNNVLIGKIIGYVYLLHPYIFKDTTPKGYPSTKESAFLFDWLQYQGLVKDYIKIDTRNRMMRAKRLKIRNWINSYLTYVKNNESTDPYFEFVRSHENNDF